jgi:4-hydroxybenzoate polyprenyltransferase
LSKIIYQCVAVPFLQQKWVHTLLLLAITGSWGCTRVAFLGFAVYKGWAYGIIKDYRTFDFKISYGCVKFGHENFDWLSFALVMQLTLMLLLQIVWFGGICWMLITQVFQGSFHDMWHDSDAKKKKNQKNGGAVTKDDKTNGNGSSPRTTSPLKRANSKKIE